MLLGYFTEDAYEKLLNDVDLNREKYMGDEEWLDSYFGRGVVCSQLSSVEVGRFVPYYSNESDDDTHYKEDCVNAINIYEAFKITPLQATNKYMWTYLCHMDKDYRQYIQKRWRGSKIEQRYFVTAEGEGLYYFNALSRLWWGAHLTYDHDSKDHYALTKILFSNQMVFRDFFGTLNRNNINRAKGVLLALKEFKEILEPREGINQYFRMCNKILNQMAAVRKFDFLSDEEIKKITYDILIKLRKEAYKE